MTAKRKKGTRQTSPGAPRYCQRRDVYVSDHEYLIPAVDPGQYYCLQKPVWEREPAEIIGPAILATVISTITAVIFCKFAQKLTN